MRAIFISHVRHAKDRGITVTWTFNEFKVWCVKWNYVHEHTVNEMTIHRKNCLLGYCYDNCVPMSHAENSKLGWSVERWMKAKIDKWEQKKEARRRATMLAVRSV
jgi:hypothetical protein